jgi:hypothetical protein
MNASRGDTEELSMGRQTSPVFPAFSGADLEVFARPTPIATTRDLCIAVLGFVAYFWIAIVLIPTDHEDEHPVRCCGTCAPNSGDATAAM